MPESTSLRRPSDQVGELRDQLLRELDRFKNGGGSEEPELYRAYLQHAQALAWQGVAEGRMDAPGEILEAFRAAEPFVFSYLSDSPEPEANAAQEVHCTLRVLQLAVEALEERRIEDRLADEPSETERKVLQLLLENRGKFLRRGAIHDLLKLPVTPSRIGQVLVELHYEGLLLRIHGRAQGNPNAAFYALSPRGLEVCDSLNLGKRNFATEVPEVTPSFQSETQPQELKQITEAVAIALNPATREKRREIVINMLANRSIGSRGPQVLETLERMAGQIETEEARQFYQELLKQVQSTRRVVVTGGKGWIVDQVNPSVSMPGTLVLNPMTQPESDALGESRKHEEELVGV